MSEAPGSGQPLIDWGDGPTALDINVAEPMISGPVSAYDPRTDELSLGVPHTPAQTKALPWLILGALAVGAILWSTGE